MGQRTWRWEQGEYVLQAYLQDLALYFSERLLALFPEDVADGAAGQLLYKRVAVQEGILQGARHQLPNCALPAAQMQKTFRALCRTVTTGLHI